MIEIDPKRFEYVGVYWYDRPTTQQGAIVQFRDFLIALQAHAPQWFSTWYKKAYTKKRP